MVRRRRAIPMPSPCSKPKSSSSFGSSFEKYCAIASLRIHFFVIPVVPSFFSIRPQRASGLRGDERAEKRQGESQRLPPPSLPAVGQTRAVARDPQRAV